MRIFELLDKKLDTYIPGLPHKFLKRVKENEPCFVQLLVYGNRLLILCHHYHRKMLPLCDVYIRIPFPEASVYRGSTLDCQSIIRGCIYQRA